MCQAPLHPDQEWCLRCGAAARTRLAASPGWKGLTSALAVLAPILEEIAGWQLVKT